MASYRTKTKLRRTTVWLKYIFPLIECILAWLLCALPLWRFSKGDGTILENQTMFDMISSTAENVKTTLSAAGTESEDVLLAKALRPLPYIYWGVMLLTLLSAILLFGFALAILTKDPESPEANQVKVKFRLFFPGRVWHFLLPIVSFSPMFIPYYIANRFTKYYGVRGLEGTESGGKAYKYYDYSVKYDSINPLIPVIIVAAIAVIIFFVAIPFERSQKMNMYRYYEPEESEKSDSRERRRR